MIENGCRSDGLSGLGNGHLALSQTFDGLASGLEFIEDLLFEDGRACVVHQRAGGGVGGVSTGRWPLTSER